ncbi:hypothetical protein V2I01_32050 [Micromonospora sp. BRA006-A]|nr:hypothetical protein [Micromonospora sp. BRA006-A]
MLPFLDLARRARVRRAVLLSSSAIEAGTPDWARCRPSSAR